MRKLLGVMDMFNISTVAVVSQIWSYVTVITFYSLDMCSLLLAVSWGHIIT